MAAIDFKDIFSENVLSDIFPRNRADKFFDALYGDVSEGAYDINLKFKGTSEDRLDFEFHLRERPGKCLACNLTYGLPDVFSRHPVIDIKGVVKNIEKKINWLVKCTGFSLGRTREISHELHIIPIVIKIE